MGLGIELVLIKWLSEIMLNFSNNDVTRTLKNLLCWIIYFSKSCRKFNVTCVNNNVLPTFTHMRSCNSTAIEDTKVQMLRKYTIIRILYVRREKERFSVIQQQDEEISKLEHSQMKLMAFRVLLNHKFVGKNFQLKLKNYWKWTRQCGGKNAMFIEKKEMPC